MEKSEQKKYLNMVLDILVRETIIREIEYFNNAKDVMIEVPFTKFQYSRPRMFDFKHYYKYVENNYGLYPIESGFLWEEYLRIMNNILIQKWGIKDPLYH